MTAFRVIRALTSVALLSCLVALGCGPSEHGTAAGGPGPIGGQTGKDVTLTAETTWITEMGEVKDVRGPGSTIAALVPKSDGSFETITGTYDPNKGSLVLPNVPVGPYYLKLAPHYYVLTSGRTIDLSGRLIGRPDAESISKNPTTLTIDATNLTAWRASDELEIFSLGANSWSPLQYIAATPPQLGDTALTGFSVNASYFAFPRLIDGSKGDKALFTHLTTRSTGGITYAALAEIMSPPAFTMTDGQSTTVSGMFTPVPQQPIKADWKRSAFEAIVASAGPGAKTISHNIIIRSKPSGKELDAIGASATLLDLREPSSAADVTLDLSYGNPFPKHYGVESVVMVAYQIILNAPGPRNVNIGMTSIWGQSDELFAGPLKPTLTPPRDITIGGNPTTADLIGVGTTPTIAWKAPATGTPTFYQVEIQLFDATGSSLSGVIATAGTSITVPPGILQKGMTYGISVTASTRIKDVTKPYLGSATGAEAAALTATVMP